jgi:hypothetical protein
MLKYIAWLALVLIPLLVIAPIGCTPQLSPATQQQIQQVKNQGALKLQQNKSQHAIDSENGKNSPLTHPIAAMNDSIVELHRILKIVVVVSWTLWLCQFLISKTQYGFLLNWAARPLRWSSILSLVAFLTLPFLPWTLIPIGALVLAAAGLFAYELIKNKGNVPEAEKDTEQLLGVGEASGLAIAKKAATPTAPIPVPGK